MILFTTDKPMLLGVSHSTCAATKYRIGHHQMNPPDYLSQEHVSFLVQFYPMLYGLPGGFEPNADLRRCAADLLWDYPAIMANPLKCIQDFRQQKENKSQTYQGDLEADYLRFLAKVQKAAKENPVNVSFNFP